LRTSVSAKISINLFLGLKCVSLVIHIFNAKQYCLCFKHMYGGYIRDFLPML
jgi:hypothetical protein